MITAKEAVKIAINYMKEFFPKETDFELEEVESADNNKDWAITISYPDKKIVNSIFAQTVTNTPRKYKSIIVNADTGNVEAMKIRKLA